MIVHSVSWNDLLKMNIFIFLLPLSPSLLDVSLHKEDNLACLDPKAITKMELHNVHIRKHRTVFHFIVIEICQFFRFFERLV